MLVTHMQPIGANYSQQHVTSRDLLAQNLDEIRAKRNCVNVHEEQLVTEFKTQPIMNAPGVTGCVLSAIADEDISGFFISEAVTNPPHGFYHIEPIIDFLKLPPYFFDMRIYCTIIHVNLIII